MFICFKILQLSLKKKLYFLITIYYLFIIYFTFKYIFKIEYANTYDNFHTEFKLKIFNLLFNFN